MQFSVPRLIKLIPVQLFNAAKVKIHVVTSNYLLISNLVFSWSSQLPRQFPKIPAKESNLYLLLQFFFFFKSSEILQDTVMRTLCYLRLPGLEHVNENILGRDTHSYITLIKQNSVSKHKRVEKQESVQLKFLEVLRFWEWVRVE